MSRKRLTLYKKNCFFFLHASSANDADDRLDFLHSRVWFSNVLSQKEFSGEGAQGHFPKQQLLINSKQMLTCVSRQRLEILKGHTSFWKHGHVLQWIKTSETSTET